MDNRRTEEEGVDEDVLLLTSTLSNFVTLPPNLAGWCCV